MTSIVTKRAKKPEKISVSIDKTEPRNYHDSEAGQVRINAEIKEVVEALNGVIGKALKKHKSEDSSKKFLALLEKTIAQDAAINYVATRLLITERLVQGMLPSMIESLTMAASKFTKTHIEETANKIFEKETHSVIIKLLGMEEDHWNKGTLKVDNCNGRQSAITEFIRSNASSIVNRIAMESLQEFDKAETPKLKKQISVNIVKQVKDQIDRSVWSSTQAYAAQKADELTKGLVEAALEDNDVFKSLCIIQPDDE